MVDEGRMFHVRNAFHTVAGGGSVKAVVRALDESGVPTPGKALTWVDSTIRRWFDCEAYRPHTYSEVAALEPGLAPGVLAKLDRDETYGIFYYNQLRTKKINGHNTRKVNDRTE